MAVAAHDFDLAGRGVQIFLVAVAVLIEVLQRVEVIELSVLVHFGLHLHFARLALLSVLARPHVGQVRAQEEQIC